jgi:SAM-dependent methyltransferase
MSWLILLIILITLLIPTAYAGLIGAPYVPVRRPALKKAFDAIEIGPSDLVVDLGAGDGGVLIEAKRRGARALGYELSPIMWAIARLRSREVYWRNFFRQRLPADTTVIFVFLMPKALPRLLRYLEAQRLPQVRYLLSYTFALPNQQPQHVIQTPTHGTVYVYSWDQLQ